jgi:hypothetical protein
LNSSQPGDDGLLFTKKWYSVAETAAIVAFCPNGWTAISVGLVTGVTLDATGAAELAQMLQFLAGWLQRDPDRLRAWLEDFAAVAPRPPASGAGGVQAAEGQLSSRTFRVEARADVLRR